MKTYVESEPWLTDPSLVPLPWRSIVLPETIKIAIMWSDGVVQPHPPIIRALNEVKASLEENQSRFRVVEWVPLAHEKGWEITQALYYEDGGAGVLADLAEGGEEPLPLTRWMLQSDNVRARTTGEAIMVSTSTSFCHQHQAFQCDALTWAMKTQLKVERNEYCQAYSDHWSSTAYNDGKAVDAILCPVGPGAAPPLGHSKYWSYTSQWNLLDYPAAVFPVTNVNQCVDTKDMTYRPRNASDKYNHDLYDPQKYVNAPVGLQLVTRRYEEEKCLAILGLIEKAMGRK